MTTKQLEEAAAKLNQQFPNCAQMDEDCDGKAVLRITAHVPKAAGENERASQNMILKRASELGGVADVWDEGEDGVYTHFTVWADESVDVAKKYADDLTYAYGKHKGLNADWAVCAWEISKGYWILDNEDGTFESVYRTENEDGEFVVESLGTITP
jgi:hypothetical protein